MDMKRAISILSSATDTTAASYTKDEWAEACQMACKALRQSVQTTYSLDSAIADHYRNIGLSMERVEELATADKAGRLVTLPDTACTDKDGEEALRKAMWVCNNTNNGVNRYTADAIAEKLCRDVQKASAATLEPAASDKSLTPRDSTYRTIAKHIFKASPYYNSRSKILLILADDYPEAERLAKSVFGPSSIFVTRIIPTENPQVYEVVSNAKVP